MINFISFRTSRDPLFSKPVTGHELFLPFLTANWLQVSILNSDWPIQLINLPIFYPESISKYQNRNIIIIFLFSFTGLRIHVKRIHETADWTFACKYCDSKFETAYGLKIHRKAYHYLRKKKSKLVQTCPNLSKETAVGIYLCIKNI